MSTGTSSSTVITSENYENFNSTVQVAALKATRNALGLPNDIAYHRSMDQSFAKELDNFSSRVLSFTNKIITLTSTVESASSRAKGKGKLASQDDVVDNFHSLVVDAMDQLLEKTDICLDEVLGVSKAPAIAVNPTVTAPKKAVNNTRAEPVIQHASNLRKPQLSFKRKVVNDDSPWRPALPHKYNAKVPVGYHFTEEDADSSDRSLLSAHPYRYEITHISYPKRMFETSAPISPKEFSETPFNWVETEEAFQSMLAKLRQAGEIAVDLEHHSYRSYAGFVCLMQISTRAEDWIVDTLLLREELTELNEVFTDPRIVKVFHGAESDIVWLQQNFDLYIVNLFDTFHASKLLEFPRHGLANLLEMYCDFIPDKRYQLADWRMRPLPQEMVDYARADTHYLLYVYDNLRNALIDRAQSRSQSRAGSPMETSASGEPSHLLVRQALSRSEETSLKTYEKEVYDEEGGTGSNGWDTLARKWNKGALTAGGPGVGIGVMQRSVYQAVHKWREDIAREEDESTRYVLANHYMFQLAEQPPADMAALMSIFHPVPPVVRRRAKELLDRIRSAVKQSLASDAQPEPMREDEQISAKDVEMVSQKDEPPQSTSQASLWSKPISGSLATTSSLLGPSQDAAGVSYLASKSSLLGSATMLHRPVGGNISNHSSTSQNPKFLELVSRINSTLVIAPSAPKVAKPSAEVLKKDTEEITLGPPGLPDVQIEIPYVPAAQRKTISQQIDDSIVVVGQARPKKRKRGLKAQSDPHPTGHSEDVKTSPRGIPISDSREGSDQEATFDFSSVPNILDDNPELEAKAEKKQKRQKKAGNFYGDFPAPPKAHSEVKRGNQSRTFK